LRDLNRFGGKTKTHVSLSNRTGGTNSSTSAQAAVASLRTQSGLARFLSGNQITANVYLRESASPEVEGEILDRVGTYGRQLGQTADAMIVLLRHLPDRANLAPEEREAFEAFEKMANDIANIKEEHKRQAVRP
jgi:hypothetical protein